MSDQEIAQLDSAFHFSLNPYPESRFSKCLQCETKTGQRKLPLVVHVEPHHFIVLNYTNRYCKKCDLLIAHRHEVEHHLTELFSNADPEVVGNEYVIIGTMAKAIWQKNRQKISSTKGILENTHFFKSSEEIQMSIGGWFQENEEPPLMEPPKSTEWLKKET